jgi:acetylornithine deacetylase/succinyl-diaminopimelate desuccinylase-like protein
MRRFLAAGQVFVARKRRFVAIVVTTGLVAGASGAARSQQDAGDRLLSDTRVKAAIDSVRRNEPQLIEEQVRLCEIPAPPFMEQKRAAALKASFEKLGLKNVRIDAVGNVLGERPGLAPGPQLVFSAHLDTVFPEGTNVQTSRNGSVIKGPGISDDCRGLAVILGVIRELNDAALETQRTITFVGTVGEEGLGDLRGVKHLFTQELKGRADRFVSVDGAGVGVTHTAVGSRRYRVTFKGPGGHSWGAFGIANPVHALGRAIGHISDLQVPRTPKTTFNVGRVGGGTSVNSIAFDAWMEVDLRSSDRAALTAIDAGFMKAVDRALADENERWGNRGRLTVDRTLVGDRPAGGLPATAPIVEAAVSVSRALGIQAPLEEGSTDANFPLSLGVAAITIDGGGRGAGSHSLDETFDSTESWLGTARALLLALALAR